jgi:fatty acid desaturase
LSELSQKASQFVIEINETSDEGKVSKISDKITERLKGFWRRHKVWSLIIAYIFGMLVVLPAIGILVGFIKDGKDPVMALKEHAVLLAQVIGAGVFWVIVVLFFFSSSSVGGSPMGNALSNLVNRRSVHPQSDYRAQDRAAQEARDAAAQGRDALNALERAGGDPTTMQKLKWEIDRADRDAKNFQEWAED